MVLERMACVLAVLAATAAAMEACLDFAYGGGRRHVLARGARENMRRI